MAEIDGEIYIEAHADVYRRLSMSPYQHARELAVRLGIRDRVDWMAADREIDQPGGVARRVSASR